MQCVAVMGLSLKLPNVRLYFWAMMTIDLTEELQLESALWSRMYSHDVSSPFGSIWDGDVLLLSSGG